MGIPSYFSLIIRKYRSMVRNQATAVDHFLLDCNSIIYDAYHALRAEHAFTEDALCERTVATLIKYIRTVKPKHTVFIAFDGVAPAAKMEQQRTRRFKGAYFPDTREPSATGPTFHLSSITPGTAFMDKLMRVVANAVVGKEAQLGVQRIVFSPSHDAGEGEHKLFHFLRERGPRKEETTVIYGLDADLIMLSIYHVYLTHNIFVCREPLQFASVVNAHPNTNQEDALLFLDIAELHRGVFLHLCDCNPRDYNAKRVVDDYVFLCFLLGNDFMPHFPTLNLRTRGMDVLMDMYRHSLLKKHKYVVDAAQGTVLWKHVQILWKGWASMEHELLLQEHVQRNKLEHRLRQSKKDAEDVQNLPALYRAEEHYICPGETGWQKRYYRALFEGKGAAVADICRQYHEGLEWTFRYYTSSCPDWRWKYPHHYAPLFQDLACYDLPNGHTFFRQTTGNTPVTPTEQLQYVLPACHRHLIPSHLASNSETPEVVECRYAYCRYFWESHIFVS